MYINNVLYCFYSSDTEALEACFRLLHDDDDDDESIHWIANQTILTHCDVDVDVDIDKLLASLPAS